MVNTNSSEARVRVRWLALALIATCGLSLAATDKSRAAACMSAEACLDQAHTQTNQAGEFSNKATWFRATSQQNFINAKQWGDKATFAFHAGDATAAAWYKAIADDYSRKAVADAKAATDYAAKAQFASAAAADSLRRGKFFSALEGENEQGITDAKVKFGGKCVPRRAQAPTLRVFHHCFARKIERVPNMWAIPAAAYNAMAYCTAMHTHPSASLPGYFFSLFQATSWCKKWKWGWVIVIT